MNTPANSQGLSAGIVEKAGLTDPHAPPSFNSQERMMSRFTPGPWTVDMASRHFMWTDSISISNGEHGHICHLTRGYEGDEHGGCPSWANARLIAAAPELYDALDAIMRDAPEIRLKPDLIVAARAALAKAEGTAS